MENKKIIKSFIKFNEGVGASDVSDSPEFEKFLDEYAKNNFGLEPDGKPAYYLSVGYGTISIGSMLNPKYHSVPITSDKEEAKAEMADFAKDMIYDIEEKFGLEYFIEFITINDKKRGVILKQK